MVGSRTEPSVEASEGMAGQPRPSSRARVGCEEINRSRGWFPTLRRYSMSNIDCRAQLIAIGNELYSRGLQTTRSGNISIRVGDQFLITKTGSNLGKLLQSDLIAVDIRPHVPIPTSASCESPAHRAIYNATEALAIVHAHPIHAIALAQIWNSDSIEPIHNEGIVSLRQIPIICTTAPGEERGERPDAIAASLTEHCSVVVRNHGAFTVASSLEQALYRMLLLEDTCRIVFLVESLKIARQSRHSAPTRRDSPAKLTRARSRSIDRRQTD